MSERPAAYKIDRNNSSWWRYGAYKIGLFGWWWKFSESDDVPTLVSRIHTDAQFPILFNDKGERL